MYGVEVKALNQAVRRNVDRFPPDFMFQLTTEETESLRSQSVTSKVGRGGRRYLPLAFTQEGVAMLSSVLRSEGAVLVNVEIMRAFVRMRAMVIRHEGLARRLDTLERQYEGRFKMVFVALRRLMVPRRRAVRRIGFEPRTGSTGPALRRRE
jgi:hypothetical protein